MTNPSHPKHRCFMQDFAALDSRSVHAHLRGRSLRAQAYVLFDGFNHLLGRSDNAANDFRRFSRWLFRHRQPLQQGAQAMVSAAIALSGMAAGIALYLLTQG
ncbi:MAG: hypothetical protein BGO63_18295 [Candidatus Accumulibacter sp. 66-26]|jgi:hypothetical protein|nr:hypothetical protein [Accumulibacter sp.]OJW51848.1 MAG: hypothetical protein BGO63_18295 [Candidatus Accumulibacter sp. 66-26]